MKRHIHGEAVYPEGTYIWRDIYKEIYIQKNIYDGT